MTELIDFVKEQSSSYVQYNETAVAKALVRGTTAVQELDGVTLDCGEDELRQYVERLGLTGISVLDGNGRSTARTASAIPACKPIWKPSACSP